MVETPASCVLGWGLSGKGQERVFWGDGSVLHHVLGGGFTGVHNCQKSLKRILGIHTFYCL